MGLCTSVTLARYLGHLVPMTTYSSANRHMLALFRCGSSDSWRQQFTSKMSGLYQTLVAYQMGQQRRYVL